jgi:hypothetical protein
MQQLISAFVVSPIEQYLHHLGQNYWLRLSPVEFIQPADANGDDLVIRPTYTVGTEVTKFEDLGAAARISVSYSHQGSLSSSLAHSTSHRITIVSVAQSAAESANNKDFCAVGIVRGLDCEATIRETGGIAFSEYQYNGICWQESALSPVFQSQSRLWKSRTVIAISMSDFNENCLC